MKTLAAALILPVVLLAACKKKEEPPVDAAPAAATAPAAAPAAAAAPAEPAELTPEQTEMKKKQALMDYTVMEDKFINDPAAQWAASAKGSTTYGSGNYDAAHATGAIDNKHWKNNSEDIGFDNIELAYAKPVSATEVRVIFPYGTGIQAISKIELQDTDNKWHTVWTGISDGTQDLRGDRTWFVRSFDKTAYKAKTVRLTFANNLEHVLKEVEAVQLVGQ